MSDEWTDGDCPTCRDAFGYALRKGVAYQDGRNSKSPALVFADTDYEVGDGVCGLHADGKSANEPAIIYTRADALIEARAKIEAQAARIAELEEMALQYLLDAGQWCDLTDERDALRAENERLRGLFRRISWVLSPELSETEAAAYNFVRAAFEGVDPAALDTKGGEA